jgi:uncharacterized membrane protein YvlD (DUF360 family)
MTIIDRLILHIVVGTISFWTAVTLISGVEVKIIPDIPSIFGIQFTAVWQVLILIGSTLGLINLFIKPIISAITLPLRVLTLGLFGLIINIAIIWLVDILFPELIIDGLIPLFWTSVIVWIISFIYGVYKKDKN